MFPFTTCATLEIDLVYLKTIGGKEWCNEWNNHVHVN